MPTSLVMDKRIPQLDKLEDVCIAGLDWSVFKVDQAAVKEYQRLEEVSKSLPELM